MKQNYKKQNRNKKVDTAFIMHPGDSSMFKTWTIKS